MVCGVDQRPRLGLGDPHGDCASAVADVRDLAVALVGRAVDSVVFGLAAVAPHLLGGRRRESTTQVLRGARSRHGCSC